MITPLNCCFDGIHFLTYPWGGPGVKIWPIKTFLEIIYKIHRSTQFLALIPNMLFIWGKLGLFRIKTVGYESKNTINGGCVNRRSVFDLVKIKILSKMDNFFRTNYSEQISVEINLNFSSFARFSSKTFTYMLEEYFD